MVIYMSIQEKLIKWYEVNKRDLPFRDIKDPYKIWVSEIMREFDSCLQFFTNQIAQNVDYINAFEFFYCQICENNCTNTG